MSEDTRVVGKMIPYGVCGDGDEEIIAKSLMESLGIKQDKYYTSCLDQMISEFKLAKYCGRLYRVLSKEVDTYTLHAEKQEDNSINFDLLFYNGACSECEALEGALKGMDNDED